MKLLTVGEILKRLKNIPPQKEVVFIAPTIDREKNVFVVEKIRDCANDDCVIVNLRSSTL